MYMMCTPAAEATWPQCSQASTQCENFNTVENPCGLTLSLIEGGKRALSNPQRSDAALRS